MFDRPRFAIVRAPRWEALVIQYYADLDLYPKADGPQDGIEPEPRPPSIAAWRARRTPAPLI